jgi:hypothetical protein
VYSSLVLGWRSHSHGKPRGLDDQLRLEPRCFRVCPRDFDPAAELVAPGTYSTESVAQLLACLNSRERRRLSDQAEVLAQLL